jgi:hypothetical protein
MKLHYFNCPSTNFVMIFLILLLLFCFWTNWISLPISSQ